VPVLAEARRRADARGVALGNAGIWGMPELFSLVLTGPAARTDALAEELQLETARLGGSIEYCHGVGLRMAHLMPVALGPAFPVLARIKQALDPSGLLNPGKQGL
jgi:FAD/FMN-containing dehydrogenase